MSYRVVQPSEVACAIDPDNSEPVLAEVLSPLSRAIELRIPVTTMLQETPDRGQEELEKLSAAARQDIETAILAGADGIYYRLRGAEPGYTTPMEYGGFFLELDRELLTSLAADKQIVICVEGGDEVYVDALSDLPGRIVLNGNGSANCPESMEVSA